MHRTILNAKIDRATLPDSDLHFLGSITIDLDNGARFETYTIAGERGSGQIKVNGAAARLVHRGDTIIVIAYGSYGPDEIADYRPRVVHVDAGNQLLAIDHDAASLRPAPVA